ncbi:uncharacterized protein LOC141943888 isoform X4 [Strix uralensis]|uniref:uncharacterized protein LOC141943888 isoform X4 n=1 Tax=Strix uralensis TaxID=36305 RepID=UPI003DA6F115
MLPRPDFLAAAALLSTATIQLLPAPLFIPAYAACPYGLMLATTFYAVSFLMVVVYAYEAYRAVRGRGAWHVAALQPFPWGVGGFPCVPAEQGWALELLPNPRPRLTGGFLHAGEEPVPGERVAGAALRPGLAGASTHAPGAADCPRHLPHRHRAETPRACRAGERQPLPRDLQPLLLQLLYRRVKLWCRRKAAAPLLTPERDGFAGRSIRSVSRVSHYFQLVFLLCWAPAFLLTLLSFTSIKPASVFALYVTTALTVSLQGFLHSLVYGWLRQNFRREVVGKRPSPQQRHRGLKAFYDDSLGPIP